MRRLLSPILIAVLVALGLSAPAHAVACPTTTVSGVPHLGFVLTAVSSSPPPSYQWYRENAGGATSTIPGATGPSYTPTADDVASAVYVRALVGSPTPTPCPTPSNKTYVGGPLGVSIEGKAKVGKTLTAASTAVENGGYATYQWFRTTKKKHKPATTTPIGGATAVTYKAKRKDRGKQVSVTITYHYPAGAPAVTSAARKIK